MTFGVFCAIDEQAYFLNITRKPALVSSLGFDLNRFCPNLFCAVYFRVYWRHIVTLIYQINRRQKLPSASCNLKLLNTVYADLICVPVSCVTY